MATRKTPSPHPRNAPDPVGPADHHPGDSDPGAEASPGGAPDTAAGHAAANDNGHRAAVAGDAASEPLAAGNNASVFTMDLDALRKRIEEARQHLAAIGGLLPGLVAMTAEDRRTSAGRFRPGEGEALAGVLALAERRPQLFESLADRDHGVDPAHFEVGLLRDRLARIELLASMSEPLEALAQLAGDSVVHLGELTKPTLLLAYALGKALAQHDVEARSDLAQALDYYGRASRRAAASRKAAESKPSK